MYHIRLTYLSCILCLTMLIMLVPAFAQEQDYENSWKATEQYFRDQMQQHQIVGGALLFLEKGKVRSQAYHGMADIERKLPMDEHAIMHWASITKTLTAIGIMQLRDRGLLSLDDPLTRYLPELRQVHNPYGSMDAISIRMVMSHSAGFQDPTWPWGGQEAWHPFEPTTWSQLTAMLPYTKIHFPPGSKYSYSNPAIIFLGRIIELLSGDDYEVYVDKNILKPLQMYHAYYDITPYHLIGQRANNYTLRNELAEANGLDFDTGITASNGGLNAPLNDMVQYLAFLSGYPENDQVLGRASLLEMWKLQLPISEQDGGKSGVGLSFFTEEVGGMHFIGHTGTQKSFYSFFYLHPESGTACVHITNTDGELADPESVRVNMSQYLFNNHFRMYREQQGRE